MARLGLLQFDMLWENAAGNRDKVLRLLDDGAMDRVDLLILPELWPVGFTMNLEAHRAFDAGLAAMDEIARTYECLVLGGLPAKTAAGQENRCYLVGGDGEPRWYAKAKTFKYAGEHHKYRAGAQVHRWPALGFQLTPLICYDLRFPELPRAMVPETTLLVYVANWPAARAGHWRALLAARAIENLCFAIGVNRVGRDGAGLDYCGDSMAISPAGEILLDAGDQEGLLTVDIDPQTVVETRKRWPFLDDK